MDTIESQRLNLMSTSSTSTIEQNIPDEKTSNEKGEDPVLPRKHRIEGSNSVGVTINLQLQLPDVDDPRVYQELFKALRKHLIDGED